MSLSSRLIASSTRACVRPLRTTFTPESASSLAIAKPTPAVELVTIAGLLSRLISIVSLFDIGAGLKREASG